MNHIKKWIDHICSLSTEWKEKNKDEKKAQTRKQTIAPVILNTNNDMKISISFIIYWNTKYYRHFFKVIDSSIISQN